MLKIFLAVLLLEDKFSLNDIEIFVCVTNFKVFWLMRKTRSFFREQIGEAGSPKIN